MPQIVLEHVTKRFEKFVAVDDLNMVIGDREFVTLLGPKLSTSGIPEKFHGTDFDTVFWKVRPG